ncbi:MAG: sialidase family protein [Acidimicrobiales bacterium]
MARSRRGAALLCAVALVAATACTRPTADRPQPYRVDGDWSWVPVGSEQPEPVATVWGLQRVRLGNGLWEAPGWTEDTSGRQVRPALWVSPDGAEWRPVGVPLPDTAAGWATTVADDGATGLLAGVVGSGPQARPTIWRSTDGWRWADPVTLPLPGGVGGAAVLAVARAGGRWVAVGGPVAGQSGPALAWTSDDGRTWSVAAVEGDASSRPVSLEAVAAVGDVVVALGVDVAGVPVRAVRASDGTWSAARLAPEAVARPSGPPIAAGPLGDGAAGSAATTLPLTASGGVLATAASGVDGTPVLWRSTDGRTWSRGPSLPATGAVRLGDADGRLRAAVSASAPVASLALAELDGDAWRSVPGPSLGTAGRARDEVGPGAPGSTVAAGGPGSSSASTAPGGSVPPGPVVTGLSSGGWVVLGPAALGAPSQRTWRSVGSTWVEGDAEAVAPAARRQGDEVLAVVARPGALVAAGRAGRVAPGGLGPVDPVRTEARLWASADAVSWTEVPVSSAGQELRALATDEQGGVLAAGSLRPDEGGGPLWLYAADGRSFARRGDAGPSAAIGGIEPHGLARAGGRWVAVGTVRPSDQPTAATGAAGSAAAWWSPDGATWERLPGPDDAGVLTAACVAGDHVWAIGRGADGTALVWREPIGGGPFERAALEPPATGWVPSGCDADGATGGVLLAGLAPDPAAAASPSAAEVVGGVTPVGQAWLVAIGPDGAVQRRPGPAAAFVGGVASDGRAVTVVGSLPPAPGRPSTDGGPAVWTVDASGGWSADISPASLVTGPPPGRAMAVWAPPGPVAAGWPASRLVAGSLGDGGFVLRRSV